MTNSAAAAGGDHDGSIHSCPVLLFAVIMLREGDDRWHSHHTLATTIGLCYG